MFGGLFGGGGGGLLGGAGPGGLIGDFLHGLIDGRHGHEHDVHGEDEDSGNGFDDIFGGILNIVLIILKNEIKYLIIQIIVNKSKWQLNKNLPRRQKSPMCLRNHILLINHTNITIQDQDMELETF